MVTQNLVNLTNAMAEFEGWIPQILGSRVGHSSSVSYRNHNPGNLRRSIFALGKRDGFAYFYNDATGMFAMRFDIMQKCRGRTVTDLDGNSTLRELIEVYCADPPDVIERYVTFVCGRTGLSPNMKLSAIIK